MSLLYLVGFFVLYCFFFAAPTLQEILRTTPPGPEQERIAQEAVRLAIRPKLPIALLAALLTTVLGSLSGALPGTKRSKL